MPSNFFQHSSVFHTRCAVGAATTFERARGVNFTFQKRPADRNILNFEATNGANLCDLLECRLYFASGTAIHQKILQATE